MRRRMRVLAALAVPATLGGALLHPTGAGAARSITPTTFTVTTAADPTTGTACPATATAACSLRAAVAAAAPVSGVVRFGVPGPFVLTQGQIGITSGSVIIQGSTDRSTVITLPAGAVDRLIELGFPGEARESPSLTLLNVVLTGGHEVPTVSTTADGFGGAIDVNSIGTLTILDSELRDNTADCNGGAIDVNSASTVLIARTTFDGNSVSGSCSPPFGSGGAIDINTGGTALIADSTFTGNSATVTGSAISANATGLTVALTGDTINGNSAAGTASVLGAAVADLGTATVSIANSIVAGNGVNCFGPVTDGGNNLEDGATSCAFTTNAKTGFPQLALLAYNGGFAPTESLKPGSPAIDAGSDTICAGGVDERNVPRAEGAHCDIGAFEVVQTTTALAAPATAAPGDTVTLTATVTPKVAVPGQPVGTVTFLDGTTVLGTVPATGTSPDTVSFTTAALAAGSHSFTARFSQTPLFLASTSAAAPLTAVAAVSTTTTTSSSTASAISAAPNTGGGGAGAVAGSGAAAPITGSGLARALALGLLLIGTGALATTRGRLRRR